ncbi:MAG: M55 family metallopeptidase, partial [Chloroflexia bacterium]
RNLAPQRARVLIEEAARKAVAEMPKVPVYDPGKPCEIRVELVSTDRAEAFRYKPGVEIPESRTVVSKAEDWWTAWRQFWF